MDTSDIPATLRQALLHQRRGEMSEAEALYRAVLARNPDHFDALHLLGVAHYQQGRYALAEQTIQRAIEKNRNDASAQSNLGLVLRKLSRPLEALACFDHALALQPDHLAALNNRGSVLRDLKRNGEALASYERALSLNPRYAEALKNRGAVLIDLQQPEEALASYEQALAGHADDIEALFGRGNALMMLKRPAAALECYERVLAAKPDHADAWRNKGSALLDLERFEQALASTDRALAFNPCDAEALNNRGSALVELDRHNEALASFEQGMQQRPDDADAEYNASLCRLALGDFERGFESYEARWRTAAFRGERRDWSAPLWRPDVSSAGKTVLLYAEQGLGDTLQFCRYAPLVAAHGARVVLEAPAPLVTLLRTLDGVAQVIARGEPLPSFDYQSPLLSLPPAFATTIDSVPANVPYLHTDPARVSKWRTRLDRSAIPVIGLAWAGSTAHKSDRRRSIPLAKMSALLSPLARFVTLQKELRHGDDALLRDHADIVRLGEELTDFADTAALVSTLDLVISVDTAVAHVAGAIAKEVWILLPFNPDWRWMLARNDSPWYPTARLFRQSKAGDWGGVIERVASALAMRLAR